MFARSQSVARGVTLTLVGLLTATTLAPSLALAQESLAPGSVATNAANETVLVRSTPGWDAAAAGEVAPGSAVTVSDYPVTAEDGSLWYPVDGGYVPASAMASETAAAAPEVTGQASGYLDANGVWVEETAAAPAETTGYVDANGAWVDTTGQMAPQDQSTGYVDANGIWVDTTGQAATEAAPVAESTGYLDENGVWVDTTVQAPVAEAAPVAETTAPVSGYYDQNGIWVEGTAETAVAPVQSTGYVDANGVWVDTTSMDQASGTVVYDNAAGQSNINTNPSQASIGTAYIAGTNGEGAICRAGADWAAAEIGMIPEGSAVEVTGGTVGEWQPVNCNGVAGYVHTSFVSWSQPVATDTTLTATGETSVTETPAAYRGNQNNRNNRRGNNANNNANAGGSGQAIANYAMQYQGYPYVYAGEGPNAFDCSGFTKWVIQNTLGIDITHDMFAQYDMGTKVDRSQLQPGDLVFFQNTFRPGMSHNGIYIGNGQMIHAENESTGVKISDINSDYYSSRWYGAVRFSE